MNIYDKITNCEKIVCFIEGCHINQISIIYKKNMMTTLFYDEVISIIDSVAKHCLIEDITLCGYEREDSKKMNMIFKGGYIELQELIRGGI